MSNEADNYYEMENVEPNFKNQIDSESSDDGDLLSEDVLEEAKSAEQGLLPKKSAKRYQEVYNTFSAWMDGDPLSGRKKINKINKDVLMAYFSKLSKEVQPPSLWSIRAMLKAMIQLKHNINIDEYKPLIAFIKRQNEGYESKKAKILTEEQVEEFITTAYDDTYLATKVALIFGVYGALRLAEIANIQINDIETHNKLLLVKIWKTKSKKPKSFVIGRPYFELVKKYQALRPKDADSPRFFLNYQKGKCTTQVIGRNKIAKMPKEIAEFLKLEDPELYTGHCFRRSSTSVLANAGADSDRIRNHGGWQRDSTARGYVESSIHYKNVTQNIITAALISKQPSICPPLAKKAKPNPVTSTSTIRHSFTTAAALSSSSSSASNIYLSADSGTENDPVAQEPAFQEPTVHEPFIQESVAEDPPLEDPVTENPATNPSNTPVETGKKKVINLPGGYPMTITLNNCPIFEFHFGKE